MTTLFLGKLIGSLGSSKYVTNVLKGASTKAFAAEKSSGSIFSKVKNFCANKTKIGRGIRRAKESVNVEMDVAHTNYEEKIHRVMEGVEKNSEKIVDNLSRDDEFVELFKQYIKPRMATVLKVKSMPDEEILKMFIESAGVGPTKLAQMVADKPEILAYLKKECPDLVKALKECQSGCSYSRTLEEAQKVVEEAFPTMALSVDSELGAASIGAVYNVKNLTSGEKLVLKMIKKGIDAEQLTLEEKIFSKLVMQCAETKEGGIKLRAQIAKLYEKWRGELNFVSEFENNELLRSGAKRYRVAEIRNISKDGRCILMDRASGIKMDKLIEKLQEYKMNPNEFFNNPENKKLIAENPWLANPEKVMHDLPTTLLRTFDEQFMFMKKGGKSLMHGDPHKGNFFITATEDGRLIPEFIDTGNCVMRTGKQIVTDVEFFSNYFVGNSEGVAEYFVNLCGYMGKGKARTELVQKLAKSIQSEVFGVKQNITNFGNVEEKIENILKTMGLDLSPEHANALKAQMQFFSSISESAHLAGQRGLDVGVIISDIPKACVGMIKSGVNPMKAIKSAFKYFLHNKEAAMGNAYQFKASGVKQVFESAEGGLVV